MSPSETPPRWDLSSVYPSLDSPEYAAALQELDAGLERLEQFAQSAGILAPAEAAPPLPGPFAAAVNTYLAQANALLRLFRTLNTYASLHVAVDSYNHAARRCLSQLEQTGVRLQKISMPFQAWLGRSQALLPGAVAAGGEAAAHAFFLQESAEQARYLMSRPEEALAAELNLSGANAWGKLQGTVVSQLNVPFDGETLPVTALINLRGDPDREVRRRAYQAEQVAWKSVAEPLAAAMNGVKGAAHTLNLRRGRSDDLHASLDQARIDRPTLEAMLEAIRQNLPVFRSYLRAKAARLGSPTLPWWDLFAPGGRLERRFTFSQARQFVLDQFGRFSPELSDFAREAFDQQWIDAEPRDGKRAGAFCSSLPAVEESRVMLNFDGSLDTVFTLAHELGHAYHNRCLRGVPPLNRSTPMTLAETASTFCETIVTDAALSQVTDAQEELSILETFLIGSTQVCVDITARFLFESRVFERRAAAELSAAELCQLMAQAQQETYGDALDPNHLHPYMWTWKPHYYSAGLHFYNYPYAFGLLFGLGLYARYQQQGADFLPHYKQLLASTGQARPADLAARFGIDIRTPAFWQSSLAIVGQRIARYNQIA